jgi:hypothetical protein
MKEIRVLSLLLIFLPLLTADDNQFWKAWEKESHRQCPGNQRVDRRRRLRRFAAGLALAITAANFPEQKMLVSGAVVIYLLLRMILSIPYARWRNGALSVPRLPTPARFPPGFVGM